MRAVALLVLLAAPAASGALPLAETIVPGFFPLGHGAPGSAVAGSVDAWSLRVEKGQRLDAVLSWSGDASLALGLDHAAPCVEQLCLQRLVSLDAPGACPEAEGSLVAGTREVHVAWVAQASGRVALVVHPGLVARETPYALDLRVDGEPADARLDMDDSTVIAWPWVAACRL